MLLLTSFCAEVAANRRRHQTIVGDARKVAIADVSVAATDGHGDRSKAGSTAIQSVGFW